MTTYKPVPLPNAVQEKSYTTFQVAKICGVYPSTVINWVDEEKLPAYRTPGGHRRVLEADLMAFLNKYKFPVPSNMGITPLRLLIVEDDDSVGRLLQKTLRRSYPAAEILWIKDGIEALLAMGGHPPDLVILDVVMPILDGAKVLATLRADPKTRPIKVLGITGKHLPPEKMRFMRRYTDAFLRKPFDISQFVQQAASLLALPRRHRVG